MARSIEDRYRRLLLAYPAEFRREHGDDLLAVALDVADADGRDRPTLAERIDLVGHGLARRARGWRAGARSPVARDALVAAAVVLPMLLAARLGRGVVMARYWTLDRHDLDPRPSGEWLELLIRTYLSAALWLVVAILLCLGLRRAALLVGPLAVMAQAVEVVSTSRLLIRAELLWLVAGMLTCAVLLVPGVARRGVDVVGRRWLAAILAGVATVVVAVQLVVPGRGLGNGFLPWLGAVALATAITRAVARRHGRAVIALGPLVGLYLLVVAISLQWVSLYSASVVIELTVWGLTCLAMAAVPLAIVIHRERLTRAWGVLVAAPDPPAKAEG